MTIQELDQIRLDLAVKEMLAQGGGDDEGELLWVTKTGEEIRRPPRVRRAPIKETRATGLAPQRPALPAKSNRKPDLGAQEDRMGRYEREGPTYAAPLYGDAMHFQLEAERLNKLRREGLRARLPGRPRCH
jgi:hypothetical protein